MNSRLRFGSDVAIVVPAFNEGPVLRHVVTELREYFERVVCVDDGSLDDSAAQAAEAGARVLRHPINVGQGAALRSGIEYALGLPETRWIVTFDGDGQHAPLDAVRMLEVAEHEHAPVVLGSRFRGGSAGIPSGRRLLLRLAVLYTRWTTGLAVTDTHNGLRVLSRAAAELMTIEQPGMAHASEILRRVAESGLPVLEEPVTIVYTHYSRAKGQGNLDALNILHDLMSARLRAAR